MGEFLTWNDILRMVNIFPYSVPLYDFSLKPVCKSKKDYYELVELLKNRYCSKLDSIGLSSENFKSFVQGSLILKKTNGKMILSLDPDLYFIEFIHVFSFNRKEIDQELKIIYNNYCMNDNQEEYLKQVKLLLIKVRKIFMHEMDNTLSFLRNPKTDEYRNNLIDMLHNYKNVYDTLSKPFDEEFLNLVLEHIDYNKFILYFSSVAFTSLLKGMEEKNEKFEDKNELMAVCKNYVLFVTKMIEDNPQYYCEVKCKADSDLSVNDNSVMLVKNILDFFKNNEMEDTSLAFANKDELMDNCLIDYKKNLDDYQREIRKQERLKKFADEILCGWDFFPEKSTGKVVNRSSRRSKKSQEEIDALNQKREEVLKLKQETFSSTPCLTHLNGINKFVGYVAYVYMSGKVILEKFYNTNKKGEITVPTINEAVYVMDISTFVDLTKKGKTEIRELIKENIYPTLNFIPHNKNFKQRIESEIEDIRYDEATLDYIEAVIETLKKAKQND